MRTRLAVSALALIAAHAAEAQNGPPSGAANGPPTQSVTVVNGAGNPVPVTGSVGVTGSVSISNTPSVNVTGLGGLAVERGILPYQVSALFNQDTAASCPNNNFCLHQFPAIPSGYRLVVTHAFARFGMTAPNAGAYAAIGVNGNVGTTLDLFAAPMSGAPTRLLASTPVTYYVNAGQQPTVFIIGSNVYPTSTTANVGLSGYLIATGD